MNTNERGYTNELGCAGLFARSALDPELHKHVADALDQLGRILNGIDVLDPRRRGHPAEATPSLHLAASSPTTTTRPLDEASHGAAA